MSVFNNNKTDHTRALAFLDPSGGQGIQRFDTLKYRQFDKLTDKQLGFFWRPEEVDVLRDAKDFKDLTEHEQHIFTSNLKRQILLDSVQGRSPNLAFLPLATIPELETWIQTWAFNETIHSRSYTHIIRNVYANPNMVFDELTSILIEGAAAGDQEAPKDLSPLESQRFWERQAEENVLVRLEKGGMLAPAGAVDEVLNTVVTNLIVSAKLGVDARCRVLLTTPMETFVVGRTIVISRGLIDVLPDEASLALALAGELAHIALGHPTQTQFAFHSQTMLSDQELLQRFRFRRTPEEALAASKKTIEIMRASPYQNTANLGLFLKALEAHSPALPRLLQANLGDQVADPNALRQLAEFAAAAPDRKSTRLNSSHT